MAADSHLRRVPGLWGVGVYLPGHPHARLRVNVLVLPGRVSLWLERRPPFRNGHGVSVSTARCSLRLIAGSALWREFDVHRVDGLGHADDRCACILVSLHLRHADDGRFRMRQSDGGRAAQRLRSCSDLGASMARHTYLRTRWTVTVSLSLTTFSDAVTASLLGDRLLRRRLLRSATG